MNHPRHITNPMIMTTLSNTEHQFSLNEYDQMQAAKTIRSNKLALLVADENWSIVGHPEDLSGLEKIVQHKIGFPKYRFEILVNSLEMFKAYVPKLHPRIETLINYHTRPLSIVLSPVSEIPKIAEADKGKYVFRLVQDQGTRKLIDAIGCPLISCYAVSEKYPSIPDKLGMISSEILELVDFVLKPQEGQQTSTELPVMVELTNREELDFIRE